MSIKACIRPLLYISTIFSDLVVVFTEDHRGTEDYGCIIVLIFVPSLLAGLAGEASRLMIWVLAGFASVRAGPSCLAQLQAGAEFFPRAISCTQATQTDSINSIASAG